MHPLGSGDHFASALGAAGITVRLDELGRPWWVESADPATAIESFLACAREPAETTADDPDRLAVEDSDLLFYEAYWDDGELVLTLCRQFALVEDDEDQAYLERLHLELRTRSAPAATPESPVIEGAGGSEATVDEWARRLRADPTFAAVLDVPVDVVLFEQGPI